MATANVNGERQSLGWWVGDILDHDWNACSKFRGCLRTFSGVVRGSFICLDDNHALRHPYRNRRQIEL